jgi:Flp pilus assembly protein TadB
MTPPLVVLSSVLAACSAALLLTARRSPPRVSGTSPARSGGSTTAMSLLAAVSGGTTVLLLVGGPLGVALAPPVGLAAWVGVRRMETPAARRRREGLEAGLPHVVDLLSACLRAGHAPGTAVGAVRDALGPGPMRTELGAAVARLRLGADPVDVWRGLGDHPQLGRLGRTVARALDSGASVSDAMARLAEDLRRDRRAQVEARARAVGVRSAVPLGVCMLPAFVLVGVVPLVAGSLSALLVR